MQGRPNAPTLMHSMHFSSVRLLNRLLIACTAILCLQGSFSFGQTGGAPVGAMSYTFAENSTTSVGVPLLRSSVITREVKSVAGSTLTLSGVDGGTGLLPVDSASYYLEVVGHVDGTTMTLVGHRFEVDESATRAVGTAGIVVVDTTSSLNTAAATALSGLVSYRVAVRPHWTLATLFGTGLATNINAASSVATADQVLAWDGTGFSVYYLRAGDVPQWRNIATGPANQDNAILPPGVGVYVKRQVGALTVSVVGEVRTNRFVRPAYVGAQLMAAGFPIDASPSDLKLLAANGLLSGTSAAGADQFLTWNGTSFDAFYLRDNTVPEWRNAATGVIDYTNAKLFPSGGATLLLLRSATFGAPPAQLVQAVPFSL